MNPLLIQNLRDKLERRVNRLHSANFHDIPHKLLHFFRFFDRQPILKGIIDSLEALDESLPADPYQIVARKKSHRGMTEEETAGIGYRILRYTADKTLEPNYDPSRFVEGFQRQFSNEIKKYRSETSFIKEMFLLPFYDYVYEQLEAQAVLIELLKRYKHRSEWFCQKYLWDLSEGQSEKNLALDLYAYLYEQGVDLTIEPSSITEEIDLIAAQNAEDPLLVDAKVFRENSTKSDIPKWFNQIYTYTKKYNEPFGCLVIYNVTKGKDLFFDLPGRTPQVKYGSKTVFFIVVEICPDKPPASKRGINKEVRITSNDLTEVVDEHQTGTP